MKKRNILVVLMALFLLMPFVALSQEFKCDVRVNSSQISGTDKTIYQNMQSALYEFINNTKWTGLNMRPNERIECSMTLVLKKRTDDQTFEGELNLVLRRPVFKSGYFTPMLSYVDRDFRFTYSDGQPLDFSSSTHMSEITALLGYYAYMFQGIYWDSFSLKGGDPYFRTAESVVNAAQSSTNAGWQASGGYKNRYWMTENMINPAYAQLRQFMYEYHRLGLDLMAENPQEGRANIVKALQYLENVYNSYPSIFFIQLIVDAKRDEIINVFSQGSQQEKTQVVNIMKGINPAKSTDYDAILQGGKY